MNVLVLAIEHYFGVLNCLGALAARSEVFGSWRARRLRQHSMCHAYRHFSLATFTSSPQTMVEIIEHHCLARDIQAVVALDMPSLALVDKLRSSAASVRLFPSDDMGTLHTLNNKWSFAQFLHDAELPHPQTRLVDRAERLAQLDTTFPVMTKPLAMGGGLGVRRFGDRQALCAAFSGERALEEPIIVQEFVPGHDIDISMLCVGGEVIASTVQRWVDERHLEFLREPRIEALGRRIAEAARFTGVAHVDCRIDDRNGSATVIECNPRFWSTVDASMDAGVNFLELGLAVAASAPLPRFEYREGVVALRRKAAFRAAAG